MGLSPTQRVTVAGGEVVIHTRRTSEVIIHMRRISEVGDKMADKVAKLPSGRISFENYLSVEFKGTF